MGAEQISSGGEGRRRKRGLGGRAARAEGSRSREAQRGTATRRAGCRPQGGDHRGAIGPIAVLRRRDPALLEPLVHAGDTGPR